MENIKIREFFEYIKFKHLNKDGKLKLYERVLLIELKIDLAYDLYKAYNPQKASTGEKHQLVTAIESFYENEPSFTDCRGHESGSKPMLRSLEESKYFECRKAAKNIVNAYAEKGISVKAMIDFFKQSNVRYKKEQQTER